MLVLTADPVERAEATSPDIATSGAAPLFMLVPNQAIVPRPLFIAANRLLASGADTTLEKILEAMRIELEMGLMPAVPPKDIVPSALAVITAMPVQGDNDGASDAKVATENSEARSADHLPTCPTPPSVRIVQRKPFDLTRPKPKILGADALPAASRRKLDPSIQTRSRLRRVAWSYARYSTDAQEQKSEERQFADIAAYVKKASFDEGKRFSDRGRSGTGKLNRAGLQKMMAQARLERPDAIVVEDLC